MHHKRRIGRSVRRSSAPTPVGCLVAAAVVVALAAAAIALAGDVAAASARAGLHLYATHRRLERVHAQLKR